MKQTFEELINNCIVEVAQKHKLGNNLVTGHRREYFKEAAIMALKQVREATIQDCLDICLGNDDTKEVYKDILKWVDKDSIEI